MADKINGGTRTNAIAVAATLLPRRFIRTRPSLWPRLICHLGSHLVLLKELLILDLRFRLMEHFELSFLSISLQWTGGFQDSKTEDTWAFILILWRQGVYDMSAHTWVPHLAHLTQAEPFVPGEEVSKIKGTEHAFAKFIVQLARARRKKLQGARECPRSAGTILPCSWILEGTQSWTAGIGTIIEK